MDSTAGREPTIRSQAIFAGKIISLQVDEVQLARNRRLSRSWYLLVFTPVLGSVAPSIRF